MSKYLKQQHRTWYAVMEVPKALRPKLGKARFKRSLKTDSLRLAETRVLPVIAEWKRLVEMARTGNDDLESKVAKWRSDIDYHRREGWPEADIIDLSLTVAYDPPHIPNANQGDDLLVHEIAFNKRHLLSEHLQAYLATQGHLEPKTQDMKASDLRRFVKQFKFAQDADRLALIAWVENDLMSRDGLSETTCRRIISNCRGYWEFLIRSRGLTIAKPFDGVVPVRRRDKSGSRGARVGFSPQDYQRLQEATTARSQDLTDLIMLGAYSGCRIEELCGLKVDQVTEDRLIIEDAKTKAGHRVVPIHSSIAKRVQELRECSTDGYLLSGLTFNKYGDRSNAIGKRFGRLKAQLGYGKQHVFHSFRKGVASQFEAAGVPENEAARLLGHEFNTMTYGLYSEGNIRFERLKEVIQCLSW